MLKNLDEGQIKRFLERFQVDYDSGDSFRELQEKLFQHVREEIKKRVGANPDKYRVVLLQNNLPKAPKPLKSGLFSYDKIRDIFKRIMVK